MDVVRNRRPWRIYNVGDGGKVAVHRLLGLMRTPQQLVEHGQQNGYGPCAEGIIAKLMTDRSANRGYLLAWKASGDFEPLMVWTGGAITAVNLTCDQIVESEAPWTVIMTSRY